MAHIENRDLGLKPKSEKLPSKGEHAAKGKCHPGGVALTSHPLNISSMNKDFRSDSILEQAFEVLRIESEGILNLADRLNGNFTRLVDIICRCRGRVIVAGIGKSGLIGRKIVATLNSTGTRSMFLHPVEALHGDLGMVGPEDIFLALSNSGETDELNALVPIIRQLGCPIIAFTGNTNSSLAKNSDIVIDVGVNREACPLGLAPTASTTAQLAMGDALAVVLINQKQFKPDDFKRCHPGGRLGQRLSGKVGDIMLTGAAVPKVCQGASLEEGIREIDRLGLGVTLIVKEGDFLAGIITDGDLRRLIANKRPIFELSVDEVMTPNPRTANPDTPVYDALNTLESFQITVLPITNPIGKIRGILHLHDILGKGSFKFNG